MADLYGSGSTFGDVLKAIIPRTAQAIANPVSIAQPTAQSAAGGVASGAHDFLAGLLGVARPSVTVQLPAATPASKAVAQPKVAAAKAAPAAAPAAAGGKAATAVDPLAALGKLSFRQLLTLSQASENLTPKGSTRAPTPAEVAGMQMIALNQPKFEESMKAAKDPEMKLKLQDDYTKNVLLPIMAHGNAMADLGYDPSASGN